MNLNKIDILQISSLPVRINSITDLEIHVYRFCIRINRSRQSVTTHIIRIPPIIIFIHPDRAIKTITSLQTHSSESIAIFRYPCRIITILRVIFCQIIYHTRVSAIVRPTDIHAHSCRTVISHGIRLDRLLLSILTTFQLIPRIIRQSISIHILHDPHDSRLRTPVKSIPLNGKIIPLVSTRVKDTMIKTDNNITAKTTQRHVGMILQSPGCIITSFLLSTDRKISHPGLLILVNKLSRGRQIFIYPVTLGSTCPRGRPESPHLISPANNLNRGNLPYDRRRLNIPANHLCSCLIRIYHLHAYRERSFASWFKSKYPILAFHDLSVHRPLVSGPLPRILNPRSQTNCSIFKHITIRILRQQTGFQKLHL